MDLTRDLSGHVLLTWGGHGGNTAKLQALNDCGAAAILSVSSIDLYNYRRRGLVSYFTINRNIVLMSVAGCAIRS